LGTGDRTEAAGSNPCLDTRPGAIVRPDPSLCPLNSQAAKGGPIGWPGLPWETERERDSGSGSSKGGVSC
jgi:hypothetical protein